MPSNYLSRFSPDWLCMWHHQLCPYWVLGTIRYVISFCCNDYARWCMACHLKVQPQPYGLLCFGTWLDAGSNLLRFRRQSKLGMQPGQKMQSNGSCHLFSSSYLLQDAGSGWKVSNSTNWNTSSVSFLHLEHLVVTMPHALKNIQGPYIKCPACCSQKCIKMTDLQGTRNIVGTFVIDTMHAMFAVETHGNKGIAPHHIMVTRSIKRSRLWHTWSHPILSWSSQNSHVLVNGCEPSTGTAFVVKDK